MSATLPVLTTALSAVAFPVGLAPAAAASAPAAPGAAIAGAWAAREASPQARDAEPGAAAPAAQPQAPPVDLEPVRQALLREATARGQQVDVDQALAELLDGEFRDARVLNFLPIFLLRAARSRLGLERR